MSISKEDLQSMRIRKKNDGTLWIPRKNKKKEAILDQHYHRKVHGGLEWIERPLNDALCIKDSGFRDGTYIIGKGLSLDSLCGTDITNTWPIICINESIHKVATLDLPNKLYCAQQDARLRDTCYNAKATMLISLQAQHHYFNKHNTYIYTPGTFGLNTNDLTAECAIEIAKYHGCKRFELLCFDGCLGANYAYARCIGYSADKYGGIQRFQGHKAKILRHLMYPSDIVFSIREPVNLGHPVVVDDDKPRQ